jgi:hypothetical protein
LEHAGPLALPAYELGQFGMVRIFLGPIAFPVLLAYPAFTLMDQQIDPFEPRHPYQGTFFHQREAKFQKSQSQHLLERLNAMHGT